MRKVAIIDDSPTDRLVIRGFIEDKGWQVVGEGSDGLEAVEVCRRSRPDVVLMDIKMPGKDGVEATMDINAHCPTPVVLLTGVEDERTVKRAIDAGAMAYLAKPVREEELFPAIELAVSRYREFVRLRKENVDLRETLEARKQIEKAKGLLMEKEGMTEAEAYSKIQKISMNRRISMREVAEIIIQTLGAGTGR